MYNYVIGLCNDFFEVALSSLHSIFILHRIYNGTMNNHIFVWNHMKVFSSNVLVYKCTSFPSFSFLWYSSFSKLHSKFLHGRDVMGQLNSGGTKQDPTGTTTWCVMIGVSHVNNLLDSRLDNHLGTIFAWEQGLNITQRRQTGYHDSEQVNFIAKRACLLAHIRTT